MSDERPAVSERAERLLDAVFSAKGEAVTDALLDLLRYIESLEKGQRRKEKKMTSVLSSLHGVSL